MRVTIEVQDYSNPAMPSIRIHNAWNRAGFVEVEVDGKRYTVNAKELTSAVDRADLNFSGI